MRKLLLSFFFQNDQALPPDLLSPESYVIPLSPSLAVSPSTFEEVYTNPSFFIPSVLMARSSFDLVTVAIIAAFLLLSVLSFLFIFHLRLKSRRMRHLQEFNSLWIVRLLLVTVLDFVINKSIRVRINVLLAAVMVALPMQIICLGLSWLWLPEDDEYGYVVLVMFFFITTCMAVGEVILIIKPITDALAAEGECCRRFSGGLPPRRPAEQREQVDHQEPGL
ncbi:unnamed protein product [Fraxinus pennsylvanica]|uniref:Uncharacterized protein n=1 Tax=Fraxinus pennsylvanica TaxID=56036 RepID=A0AAD1Z443_9LAMI|nr:unnamed protein product [Fraxinus pennsylvanica]